MRSATLVDAARSRVSSLADRMPEQDAVTWVHAGALAQHAAMAGLAPADLPIRNALAHLARLHTGLTPLGDRPPLSVEDEQAITDLWQRHQLTPEGGHADALWRSYPLGDLYQALSTEAKGRALCQTPRWVSKLLIQVSYDRAQELWMHPQLIDPSCGTGHILVEACGRAQQSHRYMDGYSAVNPYLHHQLTLGDALDGIHGVDVDPYAVLIARYRLLVLAWAQLRHRADVGALADLPVHVAHADSLLAQDEPLLRRHRYHVVLANPPYVTCKDPAVSDAIRARYPEVCSGKYSLALPFHQLMMELLVPGGWCAQLTANSFMKREFGKTYVEKWLTRYDMQWVIDTSGAYIPGHGTPTVIMVHRNQPPTSDYVRTVLGVRGEPSQPTDPAKGLVWTAIRQAVDTRESVERFGRGAEAAWRIDHPQPEQVASIAPITAEKPTQQSLFDLLEGNAA